MCRGHCFGNVPWQPAAAAAHIGSTQCTAVFMDRYIHTQTDIHFQNCRIAGAELLVDQSLPDFLPNAGGVVGNNAVFRLSISESVPEIFAIKVCI